MRTTFTECIKKYSKLSNAYNEFLNENTCRDKYMNFPHINYKETFDDFNILKKFTFITEDISPYPNSFPWAVIDNIIEKNDKIIMMNNEAKIHYVGDPNDTSEMVIAADEILGGYCRKEIKMPYEIKFDFTKQYNFGRRYGKSFPVNLCIIYVPSKFNRQIIGSLDEIRIKKNLPESGAYKELFSSKYKRNKGFVVKNNFSFLNLF